MSSNDDADAQTGGEREEMAVDEANVAEEGVSGEELRGPDEALNATKEEEMDPGPSAAPAGEESDEESEDEEMPADRTYDLTEAGQAAKEKQERILEEVEMRHTMNTVVVPTDPRKVIQMLRDLGQPKTFFGEREMERRNRLQKLLATMDEELRPDFFSVEVDMRPERPKERFFTEGPPDIVEVRKRIAQYSIMAASRRIQEAKRRREDDSYDELARENAVISSVGSMVNECSEIGGGRPIQGCHFSPDGKSLATCDWDGIVKVWTTRDNDGRPDVEKSLGWGGHEERATDVRWHPSASVSAPTLPALATGSADKDVAIWSGEGRPIARLKGHTDRLARIAWHPMGDHLLSASYDETWRLWDISTGTALVEQEGHSRAVYGIGAHPDGSLAASGGHDAIARVWDCRTGRNVITLQGHSKAVLAVDFSPNGYQLATGGLDNVVRIWDLRKKICLYAMPAHSNLVSTVRFEPTAGHFLLTAGYDRVLRLWSAADFSLIHTLGGHEDKVMAADVSPDGKHSVASVSYDRTVKLWLPELSAEMAAELAMDDD